jgi:beta-lactamase regulating signal transducer with metallopeptidase domain
MISNPFFLISILISAWLTFFTVAFGVEAVLRLFNIRSYRTRAMLRLLPFACLTADLIFSKFSTQHWLNPLSCDSCTQKLILQLFFTDLHSHLSTNQISLLNFLAADYKHPFFTLIFVAFGTTTMFFVLRKLVQIVLLNRSLKTIIHNGTSCVRPIENPRLSDVLRLRKTKILITDEVQIPMATSTNIILMPKSVSETVAQQEFETIIAHELEHLRWKDPHSKLFTEIVSTIFWWVPSNSWFKKTEQDQEIASDKSILKYGFDAESFASALLKVTKQARERNNLALCSFAAKTHSSMIRMQTMLGISTPDKESLITPGFIGVALQALLMILCALWL